MANPLTLHRLEANVEEPYRGNAVPIVLVKCRECDGSGDAKEDALRQCGWCMGMGHIARDRTPEGAVPENETEWLGFQLPAR